nr:helix-turn-helix domain-containing protein [uncultured Dyadobacter sp.]
MSDGKEGQANGGEFSVIRASISHFGGSGKVEGANTFLNEKAIFGWGPQPSKQWLKSRKVRKLLDVSPGKLYAMRINRQLSYMRIGGVINYDRADIEKMFAKFKIPAIK